MTAELQHATPQDHTTPLVHTRADGPVAVVTIGSGTKRNALTGPGWTQVEHRIRELGGTDAMRAIVIRGRAGTFCAGSDMTEWTDAEPDAIEDSFARMEAAFRAVEECPVPVVAEIHGVAAGAGCQLALACDLRFMADSARIGMPIARLGIMASPSFAARMAALAGPSLTRELLYTGRLLDGPAAVAAHLADRHLPGHVLPTHTERTVTHIAEHPPAAVRAAKRAVSAALAPVREATRYTHQAAVSLDDFRLGIATFLG
ncbi:enoyl-CoA hydratase/isomerase family protein [Streptomyces sp. NA02950]|uniref:enoyl-CoA hydratase/isomerase family protein n=1 Tax=Streptomyces sp. NA02950 TaxID=2742137 RepID=UPI0015929F80|nr:enoyl-CoA hydratase/isomerase family protein [Streptomyces sp. NA02950]QKV96056.1 enoyl-CoA hydratase/isomerase family protein [Streptomyces sp. NA02950]